MRYLLTLACLLLATATVADEAEYDFDSVAAKKALRDYKKAVAKDKKIQAQQVKEVEAEGAKAAKKTREAFIESLRKTLKKSMQAGNLEEANRLDAAMKALEQGTGPAAGSVADSKGRKKATKSKAQIPRDAVKWNGHHYWVSREKMTWHLARDYCESLGGHLLRIESPAENTFVSNRSPKGSYWIDVSDAEQENVWTNSKREPLQYTNWAPGQPNGNGFDPNVAHVGYLFNGDGWAHGWYNFPSGVRWTFICEWDE